MPEYECLEDALDRINAGKWEKRGLDRELVGYLSAGLRKSGTVEEAESWADYLEAA